MVACSNHDKEQPQFLQLESLSSPSPSRSSFHKSIIGTSGMPAPGERNYPRTAKLGKNPVLPLRRPRGESSAKAQEEFAMWGQANRARGRPVQESGEVKEGENPRGKTRMGPECWVRGTSSGSIEEEPGLTFCLEWGAQLERQVEGDLRYLRGDALGSSLGSGRGVGQLVHRPHSRQARRLQGRSLPTRTGRPAGRRRAIMFDSC